MRLARPLALALVLASSSAAADGKTGASDDSVVLKNGTMVSGKILDDDPKTGVTIKLANGKVRVIAAGDVKLVERALAPGEGAAPESAAPSKPSAPPPSPIPPEKTAPPEDDAYAHSSFRFGVGADVRAVLSRANSDAALKLLSPWFELHGALDIGLGRRVSLRVDPTIATFSRASEVPSVLYALYAPTPDASTFTYYRYSSVATKLRFVELMTRAELGYDFSPLLSARAGVLGGVTLLFAKGDICDAKTDLGVIYGLSFHPIAAHFGEKRNVEVSLGIDYQSVPLKRCQTSVPDGYVPAVNARSEFQPVLASDRIGVGTVGLGATYFLE